MCGSSAGCLLDEKLHGYPPGERETSPTTQTKPHHHVPQPRSPALCKTSHAADHGIQRGAVKTERQSQVNLENTVS